MLKKNKAPGPDDIVAEMLKYGGDILVHKLLLLYNKMIEQRDTPYHKSGYQKFWHYSKKETYSTAVITGQLPC